MIRLPTRPTRTNTHFPYPTLCRSPWPAAADSEPRPSAIIRARAEVAESVDAADSKSAAFKSVWVRVPPSAPCERPRPQAWPSCCRLSRTRSEEHTSELQSLMRISYAVFCLKKKPQRHNTPLTLRYHRLQHT